MKTNFLKIMTALLIFAGSFSSCAKRSDCYSEIYYMYIGENRHVYEVSANKILFQFFDSNIDSAKVKNSLQNMGIKTRKVKVIDEYIIFELENVSKEKVICLVEQWKVLEKDIYTSPILYGKDGTEFSFVPNQMLIRIKHENDTSFLSQKLQLYNIKEIRLLDFDDKTYLITISNANQKNSMQIANELYESGLFDYAEPNIIHFGRF